MAFCGGYRYKPTMSRTFSTNIASVLSLKLFTKCGFKPKACQIRRTESWEMPASLAMSQLLQWVLAAGVVSKVFVTTSSTFSSEISRGAPLRGASTMPSKDCSIKRRLHFPTMCWQTPNSLATSRLLLPWAHSNITLARSAKLCWLLGRRSINLSFSSCSLLSLSGLTGRPLGILLLLQLPTSHYNTNVIDLSFGTLVRYVDFMDNFLAPTETCHTADNFGVALTAAEYVGGTGRDLMLGVALGYTVQSRLVDHGNFMMRGFDHTAQLAFSHNAAAGRLLGLSESQIANAIAMAASSDASFAVIRAKPLSQWKGLASAQSALGAMNALFLARRGVEGPLQVVEGPNGIDNLLDMKLRIDWDKQGYEGVVESTIKKYNAMIHTQSAVHCMVEFGRQKRAALSVADGFNPSQVA